MAFWQHLHGSAAIVSFPEVTLVFEESHTGSSVYVSLEPQYLLSSGVGGRDSKASSAAGAFLPEGTRGGRGCTWILEFKRGPVGSGASEKYLPIQNRPRGCLK